MLCCRRWRVASWSSPSATNDTVYCSGRLVADEVLADAAVLLGRVRGGVSLATHLHPRAGRRDRPAGQGGAMTLARDGSRLVRGIESARQRLADALRIRRGSYPVLRDYGCTVDAVLDRPLSPAGEAAIFAARGRDDQPRPQRPRGPHAALGATRPRRERGHGRRRGRVDGGGPRHHRDQRAPGVGRVTG